MRSLLTSLGIIIGVAAVIIMVAVGEGTQYQIEQNISSLGTNMIIVTPSSNRSSNVSQGVGTFNKLSFADSDKLKEEGTSFNLVTPIVTSRAQIVGGEGNWRCDVYGVSLDFFELRQWGLMYGYLFSEKDIKANRKVVLLGKTVADNLFPDQDPTGQRVRIRNTPMTVIGVMEAKGQSGLGTDQDDMVVIPATTVFNRLKGRGRSRIDMIQIGANSTEEIPVAEEEIAEILRESHRVSGNSADDFEVQNMEEITEMATSSSKMMTLLLAAIAAVSLVVGGIGIMNIMLVSVTERTREIGIRISIGARSSDILMQFVLEAVALSIFGGIVGILLAVGVVAGMDNFTDIAVKLNKPIIFLSVGFSAAVGIFFGYYPAKRASKLNPIDALRTE